MTLRAHTRTGTLTINSTSMHIDGCWNVLNTDVLWLPLAERGDNVVIPEQTGRRAYTWIVDEGVYLLRVGFAGEKSKTGTPYANLMVGLVTNIRDFWTTVMTPPTSPTATRTASLLLPDNTTTLTANVQPKHLDPVTRVGPNAEYTLTLVVPAGRFA